MDGELPEDHLLLTGFEKWSSHQEAVANATIA